MGSGTSLPMHQKSRRTAQRVMSLEMQRRRDPGSSATTGLSPTSPRSGLPTALHSCVPSHCSYRIQLLLVSQRLLILEWSSRSPPRLLPRPKGPPGAPECVASWTHSRLLDRVFLIWLSCGFSHFPVDLLLPPSPVLQGPPFGRIHSPAKTA